MLILLPLIRRLSIRSRLIVGVTVSLIGSLLSAAAVAVAPGLLIHGLITLTVGVVFLISARMVKRPAA
jgi:hypothetical protein